jgi:hypothetical protein
MEGTADMLHQTTVGQRAKTQLLAGKNGQTELSKRDGLPTG